MRLHHHLHEHGRHPGHHHDHHHPFGRHGGGPGQLGRLFAHGDLRLVILNLIAEKPRHGYEIIKAIEEAVGGAYSPSPGTIYPMLTLLEELGYVSVAPANEGSRKLHAITDQGRAFLEANRPALDTLLARMADAVRAQPGVAAPAVVRAIENLKLAVRLRLGRQPLTEEQVETMAAILDGAAAKVERL